MRRALTSLLAWARASLALRWALLALCVRVAWLQAQPAVAAWDGAIYQRTALRIARGMGFVDTWNNLPPFRPTAFYPVGYPATLGAAYALLGAHSWVPGALNALAGALTTGLVASLAQRAWGRRGAHLAAALYAFSPGALLYTSAVMTEPLSAAVLCLALWTAVRHRDTGSARWALLTGLLLGFGGLVRPPALLVAPVLALAAVPAISLRAYVRVLLLVGVASAACVLPWTARNCARLDACALVSVNGGSNLFIGTDPSARGGYRDLRAGEGCDAVHGEVSKDRCYGRLATERIRQHPLAWLALAPAKLEQLLWSEFTPLSYLRAATHGAFARGHDELYGLLTAWHRALLFGAALGSLSLRRRESARSVVVPTLATVLALLGVHAVFFGVDRYHFVFTPLLALLAGGVLASREPD